MLEAAASSKSIKHRPVSNIVDVALVDSGVELTGKVSNVADVASAVLNSEYVGNVVGIVAVVEHIDVVGSEVSIGIGDSLGELVKVADSLSAEAEGPYVDKFGAISEIPISFVSLDSGSRTGFCSSELNIEGSDSVSGKPWTRGDSDFKRVDEVVGHVGNMLVEHFDASGDFVGGHCDRSSVVVENFGSSIVIVGQFSLSIGVVEHLGASTRIVVFSDSSTRVVELSIVTSKVFEHFAASARGVIHFESSIRVVEHFESSTRIVEQFGFPIIVVAHFAASIRVVGHFAASSRVVEHVGVSVGSFAHCITVVCKERILRI